MTKNSASLNRTLFIADNLPLLESLDNESIDLICIDPPFAKNQTWMGTIRPPLSKEEREQELATLADWGIQNRADATAAGIEWPDGENGSAKFQDIWRWEDDVHEEWLADIGKPPYEGLAQVIEATRRAHSESVAAYLTYMAIRLIEMRRVLKSTGSIYLHCDPTASHYLKAMMDSIFGQENFRNEIVWVLSPKSLGARQFPRGHDVVLMYSKTDERVWNPQYLPHGSKYLEGFRHKDAHGRWAPSDLSGGKAGSESAYKPFGNQLPPDGRAWAPPVRSRFPESAASNLPETYEDMSPLDKCYALDDAGLIHWSKGGKPYYKKYLSTLKGNPVTDTFVDITLLAPSSNERTGYPTQKPVALAERIIKASTNPGDIVLDCFAGCAYVPAAAERNGRQWIACDISPRALTVLRRQFAKFRYEVDGEGQGDEPTLIADADVTVRSPMDLPQRTDQDPSPTMRPKPLPERKFKVPASTIPEKEMLEFLLGLSGYMAWCCGFANRMPDGSIVETTNNFHLDHIDPTSKGGSHQITNRAPMCPRHNILKKDRWVHLREYRQEIADAGEMLVNTTDELIDLSMAYEAALVRYAQASEANPSRR